MTLSDNLSASPAFLRDGGEMGALMRGHDWCATSLGPVEAWPQSLRTAVRLMLNSGHPMYIFWGEAGTCLYNDAYRQSIGPERHPGSLGRPAREVWAEIWDIIGPQVEQVMSGRGATWHENALVPITRNGRREEVYWTYSYGPIDDETTPAGIGGVLVVCTETTAAVLAEQHRAAEVLRQRRIFEQAPGFICTMHGPEHVFDFVNDQHKKLFASAAWIGKPVREAFPGIAGQGFYELLDRVRATGERFVGQGVPTRFRRTPEDLEETRIFDFICAPLADQHGTVDGIFCEGFDVTDKHTAQEALRDSEEQLRLATEAAEVGLWDVDLVTDTLYWPPRVKAMFGISAGVPVTLADFYARLHPDDRDAVGAAFAAAADPARRLLYDVEYRTVGKEDGVLRWVAAKGRGVFDADGTCIRVIGTAIDISARKAVDDRLRDLNETLERRVAEALAEKKLLADIVESTDVMIMAVDLDYRILAVNPACADGFERIFGPRPKTGDDLLRLVEHLPAQRAAVEERWGAVLAGREHAVMQAFGAPGAGRVDFEISYRVLRDAAGRQIGAYQFVTDATARLREQARLAEAEEQLRQAQKIEAIGQLTGGVAHDFNNLLMVISGGLSLLDRPHEPARRQRLIEGMRKATERGAALSRQLLAFSRRQPLKAEPVDLKRRIGGMRELLDRPLRGDVQVQVRFAAGLWPVHVDPAELELVMLNLCVNARDAMPSGGTITLHAENAPQARPAGAATGDFVRLSVVDSGTGMPPEIAARVFEPFFTTKEVGKGSGLGLAQVHGFAAQSGGVVELQSVVGHGTTVTLLLPRSAAQPAADEPPRPRADDTVVEAEAAGQVLLVEDDDEVAALVTEMLRQLGFGVLRAGTADAALGALAHGRDVDLVFSDIVMPGGMNGFELAREVRRRRPALPVLLTSGYAEAAARDADADALNILAKPYRLEDLGDALRRALAGR